VQISDLKKLKREVRWDRSFAANIISPYSIDAPYILFDTGERQDLSNYQEPY